MTLSLEIAVGILIAFFIRFLWQSFVAYLRKYW